MPIQDLKAQIFRLPEQPGVYIFLNGDGETIYVGKARALRDRVRSYLGAQGSNPKTDALVSEATRLEFTVTDSVVEALALENNLIKQRMPKFNILLRDDKNYPYLKLTTSEAFPRVLLTRRVERDHEVYAGPFMPASLARKTMGLTHRLFGMRSCNEEITGRRGRPCLEYDIKRCLAPCVDALCSPAQYGRAVELTRLFLEGRNDELIERLRAQMEEAAADERFEEAAQLRDALRTVQTLRDRQQKMATTEFGDRDAFGVKAGPAGAMVFVFQMRRGRVIERVELVTEGDSAGDEAEVVEAAVQQFYQDRDVPAEIHVPVELAEAEAVEGWLSERAGRRVRLITPVRGEKRGLLDLANRNAAIAYQARFTDAPTGSFEALATLQSALGLAALPLRIECFDISTIQGSETVASMVVCEDGRMRPGEYRKYRIRGNVERRKSKASRGPSKVGHRTTIPTAESRTVAGAAPRVGPDFESPEPKADDVHFGCDLSAEAREGWASAKADDFAAMREVVMRRYRRLVEQGGAFPDLILIDGGRGQVNSAYSALEELGLANLVAVGLAKREELLILRDRPEPVALSLGSPALLLVQRIRDEAHRFALTFHRKARRMRDLRSELDDIPGIGPRRRRALLAAFGSVAGVRRASREDLTALIGRQVADAVLQYFSHR
jgi:excinuclease ABC subunit C